VLKRAAVPDVAPRELDPFEDDKWLLEVRTSQSVLSKKLVEVLYAELRKSVPGRLTALRGFVPWTHLKPQESALDEESLLLALRQELDHDCLDGVMGLTDWIAAQIVLDALKRLPARESRPSRERLLEGLPATQQLPVASRAELKLVSEHCGAPEPLLERAQAFMGKQNDLPLLGRLEGDELRIDKETLAHWAEGYDWSR
jgi:hypothetical protein